MKGLLNMLFLKDRFLIDHSDKKLIKIDGARIVHINISYDLTDLGLVMISEMLFE